jgi:hypothetical protein
MEKLKVGTFVVVKMKVVTIIEDIKGFHYKAQLLDAKPYDPSIEIKADDIEDVIN